MPPYIPAQKRQDVKTLGPMTGGELCYAITKMCKEYLSANSERYDTYGEVRHALDTTWDEYFLPRFRAYEAMKRQENGDVE